MKVAEVITRDLESRSVRKAAQLMLHYGMSGFPVIDHGNLVGIVTRKDNRGSLHEIVPVWIGDRPIKGTGSATGFG